MLTLDRFDFCVAWLYFLTYLRSLYALLGTAVFSISYNFIFFMYLWAYL